MKANRKVSVWVIVIAILILIVIWGIKSYNSLVQKDEQVSTAWSQVENVYQRRADLIPNLVATVKGYAAHEANTLQGVIDARAKASQVTVDPTKLDPTKLAEFQAAQGELSSAISRLMVVVERYPDLKANENFMQLQAQLEGTENRITVERQKFNEVAKGYNTTVRKFPKNLIASMFGFERKGYFEASECAEKAPEVKF
jgi:LemA protein